ncbi:innexin inx2-like [Oppia nitens]|uniref:innexin inx2-like n=1 Tax=Oppia nitens TaxID=1686743 RepID=UPI0023DB2890|nr:innexin inx2-like [Oppia nitens]
MSGLVKLGVPLDRLKYLTKIKAVTIDDLVFRLHYRFTFTAILVVSILITGEQFFGKPIKCIKGAGAEVPEKLIESFCWVEGTFTLPKALIKAIDKEIPAPGVEQFYEKDEVLEHSYYQWVSLVLFLQSLCFYITRYLWKKWEKNKIKGLISGLNKVILEKNEKIKTCEGLAKRLVDTRGKYNAYAFRYFICEVLNFLIVILQMVFINWFLGGEFARYGINVLNYIDRDPNLSEDPMSRVFPKLTKCTFRQFGPSGDIKRFDNLCLLPHNILNEKVYIVLWFWLYVLVIASGLMVLYRLIIMAFPQSRYYLLHKLHHLVQPKHFDTIITHYSYGDWFVLFLLGKNLDCMHYRDVIEEISKRLDNTGDEEEPLQNHYNDDEYDASESKV